MPDPAAYEAEAAAELVHELREVIRGCIRDRSELRRALSRLAAVTADEEGPEVAALHALADLGVLEREERREYEAAERWAAAAVVSRAAEIAREDAEAAADDARAMVRS